jgi:hypothetical protein
LAVAEAWRDLHRVRFADLPLDCSNECNPGVIYSEDIRDWSDKATTPDQKRMELYLDRFDLQQKRILHVGIGDSGLARRFQHRVREIVGTTIDDPEMKVARAAAIPNYTFVIHNKFSGKNEVVPGQFDFILDNNPTSPCCCVRHLAELFDFYAEKLSHGGQIITDAQGLGWVPEGSDPRWGFELDDLAAAAAVAGFSTLRANKTIYVVARSAPRRAGLVPLLRHLGRRARSLPGRIARNGPREAARISRKIARTVLVATVPWALPRRYRPSRNSD